jgi:hypothetical protein
MKDEAQKPKNQEAKKPKSRIPQLRGLLCEQSVAVRCVRLADEYDA